MESKVLFVVLLYAFNCLQLVASSPVTEDRANYVVGADPAGRLPGHSLSQNNVATNQQQNVVQNNRNLHPDSYKDQGRISPRSAFQGNTDPNHVLVEKLRKVLLQRLHALQVSATNKPLVQKQVILANNYKREPTYENNALRSQISAGSNQQIQNVAGIRTIGSSQISDRKYVPQVALASSDRAVNLQKIVQQNENVSRIQLNQLTNNQQNSVKQIIDAHENLKRLEQIDQNTRLILKNRQSTLQKDKPKPTSTSQRISNRQFQLQTNISDKPMSVEQNGYHFQQNTKNAAPNFKKINTVINHKVFAENKPIVIQDDSRNTNYGQVRTNKPQSINQQHESLQTVTGTNTVTFKQQNARKQPGFEKFYKKSQEQVTNPTTNLVFQKKQTVPNSNKNVYQQSTNGQRRYTSTGIVQENNNAGQEDAKSQRNLSNSQNIPTLTVNRNAPKKNTVRQNIYSRNTEVSIHQNDAANESSNFQKAQNIQGNINNLKQEYHNTRQTGLEAEEIIKNQNLRKTIEELKHKRQEIYKVNYQNIQPNSVLAFGNNGFQTSVASAVTGPTKAVPIIIQPKVLQTNPTIPVFTPTSEVLILTTTNTPEIVAPTADKYGQDTQKLPENYESEILVETKSAVMPITTTSLFEEIDNNETVMEPSKSTYAPINIDDQSTPAAKNKNDLIVPTTGNSKETVEVMYTTAVQSSDKPGDQNLSEPKKPVIYVDQTEFEDDEDYKPAPPIWFYLSESDFMKKLLPPNGEPLIACFFQVPSSDNDDKPQEGEEFKPREKELLN